MNIDYFTLFLVIACGSNIGCATPKRSQIATETPKSSVRVGDIVLRQMTVPARIECIEWHDDLQVQKIRQLIFDGRIVLRESDWDKDGRIDHVRIRLSNGHYWMIIDSNGDDQFDKVELAVGN